MTRKINVQNVPNGSTQSCFFLSPLEDSANRKGSSAVLPNAAPPCLARQTVSSRVRAPPVRAVLRGCLERMRPPPPRCVPFDVDGGRRCCFLGGRGTQAPSMAVHTPRKLGTAFRVQ